MTSRTSINGMKLISGSSRGRLPRRFTAARLFTLAVRELDQLDRLLLHLEHEAVDRRPEMAVEDHAGYGDDQAQCGVVKRNRDAVRELNGIRSRRGLRTENLDHADDGAEQTQERRHRGDGSERGEKAFELVAHDPADLFDRFLHHRTRA